MVLIIRHILCYYMYLCSKHHVYINIEIACNSRILYDSYIILRSTRLLATWLISELIVHPNY